MENIKWESIGEFANDLERIKVPHGWLVRTSWCGGECSICFYPDPNHDWKI